MNSGEREYGGIGVCKSETVVPSRPKKTTHQEI
jgi:hypothetical protein